MSWGNILSFDLKNGLIKRILFLISPLLIGALGYLQFSQIADLDKNMSLGDLIIYVYGGREGFILGEDKSFVFPILWLLVILLCSYFVLNYPLNDLLGFGTKVLVFSGVRKTWWMMKCLWVVLTTLYYHLGIMLTLIILGTVGNLRDSLYLNKDMLAWLFQYPKEALRANPQITFLGIGSVLCFILALNLVQAMLTLWLKPMVAFIMTSIYLILSTYITSTLFIGNFGMLARGFDVVRDGFSAVNGIVICVVIGAYASVIGMYRFERYDIINKSKS